MKNIVALMTIALIVLFTTGACSDPGLEASDPSGPPQDRTPRSSSLTTPGPQATGGGDAQTSPSLQTQDSGGPSPTTTKMLRTGDAVQPKDDVSPNPSSLQQTVVAHMATLTETSARGHEAKEKGEPTTPVELTELWDESFSGESKRTFVNAKSGIVVHERDESVTAFDPLTSDPLWRYGKQEDDPRPLVGEHAAYVITGDYIRNIDGEASVDYDYNSPPRVHAIELTTGYLLWGNDTTMENVDMFVEEDGVLYVRVGGYQQDTLHALDATTGDLIWSHELANDYDVYGAEGVVYSVSDETPAELFAMDVQKGAEVWRTVLQDKNPEGESFRWREPILLGGNLYLPRGLDDVVAFNAYTGELLWESNPPKANVRLLTAVGGITYLQIKGTRLKRTYALEALDSTTGNQIWRHDDLAVRNYIDESDGIVYFNRYVDAEQQKKTMIQAIEAATGELLWEKTSDGIYGAETILKDGILYTQGYSSKSTTTCFTSLATPIFAIDGRSGETPWLQCHGGRSNSVHDLDVDQGMLFVASTTSKATFIHVYQVNQK